jgi:hypothetical protein
MGANAEQMALIDASSIDHVSYILVLLSVACIVFLFANILIYTYDRLANAQPDNENTRDYSHGHVAGDSRVVPGEEEEFELRGLMNDDDYDDDTDENKRILDGQEGVSSFGSSRAGIVGLERG